MMPRLALLSLLVLNACSRTSADETLHSNTSPLAAPSASSSERGTPQTASAPAPPRAAPSSVPPKTGSGEPPASPLRAACDEICGRSRALACARKEDCLQGCFDMAGIEGCTAAFERLYSCLAAEPVAHWECAEDGVAAIRDGYCEKEQAGAARCVEAKTKR